MNYKTIKRVNPAIDNTYELSLDGMTVREVATKKELPVSTDLTVTIDGRSFGARHLYRRSWNKAHPASDKPKQPKEAAPAKAPRASRKMKGTYKKPVAKLKASTKQLLSLYTHQEMEELIKTRLHLGADANQNDFWDGKTTQVRIVKHNVETNQLLLRIFSQNWRNGWWFYSMSTKTYEAFIVEKHKPGHGDQFILWPKVQV